MISAGCCGVADIRTIASREVSARLRPKKTVSCSCEYPPSPGYGDRAPATRPSVGAVCAAAHSDRHARKFTASLGVPARRRARALNTCSTGNNDSNRAGTFRPPS
jgi:hypothetical protein